MNFYRSIICILLLCAGCAHYPNVRPGVSEHKITISHKSEGQAFQEAMNQARSYCEHAQNNKTPAIINEDKKYTGTMDEKTYKNSQMVKGAASTFAALTSATTQGQMIDAVDLGKPYQVTLVFTCK